MRAGESLTNGSPDLKHILIETEPSDFSAIVSFITINDLDQKHFIIKKLWIQKLIEAR